MLHTVVGHPGDVTQYFLMVTTSIQSHQPHVLFKLLLVQFLKKEVFDVK